MAAEEVGIRLFTSEIAAEGEDGTGFRHLDTWTVNEVATEACGPTEWVDPGPAVDDLAEALGALEVWETTRPRTAATR